MVRMFTYNHHFYSLPLHSFQILDVTFWKINWFHAICKYRTAYDIPEKFFHIKDKAWFFHYKCSQFEETCQCFYYLLFDPQSLIWVVCDTQYVGDIWQAYCGVDTGSVMKYRQNHNRWNHNGQNHSGQNHNKTKS